MNKRVHEIAKERGLPPKEVLDKLRAAGMNVKAPSSSVDEETALRALGNGGAAGGREAGAPAAPAAKTGSAKPGAAGASKASAAKATGGPGRKGATPTDTQPTAQAGNPTAAAQQSAPAPA